MAPPTPPCYPLQRVSDNLSYTFNHSSQETLPAFGWKLAGGKLLVQKEARLPMVDPYSGETAERMWMVKVKVRRRILWQGILALAGGALIVWSNPAIGVLLLIVALAAAVGASKYGGVASVELFVTQGTMKQARRDSLLLVAAGLLMVGAKGLPGIWEGPDLPLVPALIYPGVFLMLVWAVRNWRRSKLCFVRRKDGWYELGGLHPRILPTLESIARGDVPLQEFVPD